ncbi:hypothetical protein HanRHA438_Chr03g0109261 [Helianthus annuus]|nr:hypothetical protein HanRHA438_Chr03g0109261 [Helianthus annuus]
MKKKQKRWEGGQEEDRRHLKKGGLLSITETKRCRFAPTLSHQSLSLSKSPWWISLFSIALSLCNTLYL